MNEEKLRSIFVVGCLCLGITLSGIGYYITSDNNIISDAVDEYIESESEPVWHTVFEYRPSLSPLGEADPGDDATGILSIFGLNYSETPGDVLQGNGTDWEANIGNNVSWYADSDGFSEDSNADEGFYFVVRVRVNKTHCWDSGDNQFVHTRVRVNITTSGDETIAGTSGTAVVSQNSTSDDYIWINYYWDDGDNGYRVTTDGSITISEIKLECKY